MIPAIGSALPRLGGTDVGNGLSVGGAGAPGASAGTPAADFGTVLSQIAAESVNTLKAAEAVSIQGIQGKASTQAVVEAVMAAERTLQTAVAVRDKAVSAYLDLSRMAI